MFREFDLSCFLPPRQKKSNQKTPVDDGSNNNKKINLEHNKAWLLAESGRCVAELENVDPHSVNSSFRLTFCSQVELDSINMSSSAAATVLMVNLGNGMSKSKAKEPLDGILESISLDAPKKAASEKGCENLAKPCAPSVLQVDPNYLNADNELQRIFGSKVVKSFEKHERSGGSSRLVCGGRRAAHILRKTILIIASEHWHRWDGSLSLEFLEVIDGYHHFQKLVLLNHGSENYRPLQGPWSGAECKSA
ncbi:hypothetical protein C1H46_019562 [Malus baccata]|uniref:Uncharacterized protein n=1 Tax=Malus baccata TaxID=106549 RepID=A0A540M8J2_MALBA|nr:hypothetical protein C1H46_019562 [Malus baccata]